MLANTAKKSIRGCVSIDIKGGGGSTVLGGMFGKLGKSSKDA